MKPGDPIRAGLGMAVLALAHVAAYAQVKTSMEGPVLVMETDSNGLTREERDAAIPRPLPVNTRYSREAFRKDLLGALDRKAASAAVRIRPAGHGDSRSLANQPKVRSARPVRQAAGTRGFGTANLPYTTARADLDPNTTNEQWPYRAVGKLFYKDAHGRPMMCSASLIGPGLVVTAAHCVTDYGGGKGKLFSGWEFIPGYHNAEQPFGLWNVARVYVLADYAAGKSPCFDKTVCRDDVAVLVLRAQTDASGKPDFPGHHTGWLAYASGAKSFTEGGLTHITQIGYPGCLDSGELMQRNDAQGMASAANQDNTLYGSLMCGGSSGGPVVANFGVKPTLTGAVDGFASEPNVVIGVTSWGYGEKDDIKQQGASPFLDTNIDFLAGQACKDFRAACGP